MVNVLKGDPIFALPNICYDSEHDRLLFVQGLVFNLNDETLLIPEYKCEREQSSLFLGHSTLV